MAEIELIQFFISKKGKWKLYNEVKPTMQAKTFLKILDNVTHKKAGKIKYQGNEYIIKSEQGSLEGFF